MKTTVKIFGIIALAALGVFFTACYENFGIDTRPEPVVPEFIPVEEIKGIPAGVLPYREIVLSGKVMPENATNKRIVWSIKEDGGTGAALERNRLYSETEEGTVTLTATIKNGSGENVDYTQDFNIRISTSFAPVSSITGIPQIIDVGEYVLEGIVRPTNAANKEIDWTVRDAGTTGAVIHGNILTTTAAGTAVITATVPYGKLTEDYTQDFAIVVFTEVASIGDIPSVVQVGNYTLEGVVAPSNATNKHITWSIINAAAGATINGNVLNTTATGTVTIRATIENGLLNRDYTQDFNITISAALVAVSGITGIPSTLEAGSYTLDGVVTPLNASNKNITWSVENPGTTGATINGNILKTTATGTVTVRATIPNGLLNGTNYTRVFSIAITAPVIRSVYAVGSSTYNDSGIKSRACYWKDGVFVEELDIPNGINTSFATGIVIVNDIPYIAGYYRSGSNNVACYWVNGTRHDLPDGSGYQGTDDRNTRTFSIAAEGSTVYITGIVQNVYCYWKIEGNSEVKTVLTQPNVTGTIYNSYYTMCFAVNNGNVYIPFTINGKVYYWDENGQSHDTGFPNPNNYTIDITCINVLNDTVYMAGSMNYYSAVFYWVMGSGSYSSVVGYEINTVVQNGALRFYGRDDNGSCYWDMLLTRTPLPELSGNSSYWDTTVIAFSDSNVYIAANNSFGPGYMVLGGSFTPLYGVGGTTNVEVTGLAVQ